MTEQAIYANEARVVEQRYVGFWMRFWAYIIDIIVISSLGGILLSPFKFINDGFAISLGLWTVNGIAAALIFYVYFVLMTKYFGQTIGKMILGIKVVRQDEGPLRWSDVLIREFIGRFIYRSFGLLMLLYIVVAFTDEKQGIHDMFADTRVVYAR